MTIILLKDHASHGTVFDYSIPMSRSDVNDMSDFLLKHRRADAVLIHL